MMGHVYFKQYINLTHQEFKRWNFKYHHTLVFCKIHTSPVSIRFNHAAHKNPLPPSQNPNWNSFLERKRNFVSYLKLCHTIVVNFVCFQVSSHKICHVFGMAHYSYFACAVNESKSVLQAENQPLFLCPVCLRKLQKAVGWVHWLMYPSGLCHEGYTF